MVELVDTPDLKSCAHLGVRVQVPPSVLIETPVFTRGFFVFIKLYLQRKKTANIVNRPISEPNSEPVGVHIAYFLIL